MKHIPTLTLTALAAAASAQTAPAAAPAAKQELSYNRVVISSVSQSTAAGLDGISVFGQAKLGNGFYVAGTVTNLDNTTGANGSDNASQSAVLGYAHSLGAVAGISTDLNIEVGHDSFGLGLRALVASGLELGLAYTNVDEAQQDVYTVSANYSLGQFVKGLTVNVSYADQRGDVETTSIGVGYSF